LFTLACPVLARGATPPGWLIYQTPEGLLAKRAAGGKPRLLVSIGNFKGVSTYAAAPDGRHIVYRKGGGLFLGQYGRKTRTQIASIGRYLPADLAWSSDSRTLAMTLGHTHVDCQGRGHDRTGEDIGVLRTFGSPLEPLTQVPCVGSEREIASNEGPTFSPDGRRLVYGARTPNGSDDGRLSLMTIPVQGGSPTEVVGSDDAFGAFAPDWSPDGRLFAFARNFRPGDVAVLPAGGGTAKTVVRQLSTSILAGPRWSPDSRWIVYHAPTGTKQRCCLSDLFIVPAVGGPRRRVTTGGVFDDAPVAWVRRISPGATAPLPTEKRHADHPKRHRHRRHGG
jgi:hypothetical protein